MGLKNTNQLANELEDAKNKVDVNSKYFHYKHPESMYKILAIGFIEATEEISVIYQAEYGEKLVWVRTLEEFLSKATLPDGSQVDRFVKVS